MTHHGMKSMVAEAAHGCGSGIAPTSGKLGWSLNLKVFPPLPFQNTREMFGKEEREKQKSKATANGGARTGWGKAGWEVARTLRLGLTQREHVHKDGVGGEGREMGSGDILGKSCQAEERTVQG